MKSLLSAKKIGQVMYVERLEDGCLYQDGLSYFNIYLSIGRAFHMVIIILILQWAIDFYFRLQLCSKRVA